MKVSRGTAPPIEGTDVAHMGHLFMVQAGKGLLKNAARNADFVFKSTAQGGRGCVQGWKGSTLTTSPLRAGSQPWVASSRIPMEAAAALGERAL